ncbi:hypothetical protein [Haloprofundus halobius]|uniref:hypothetical protein n=1 Tax=Haloprofundus halobius TaxID=2876194 RepID=UPI001CCE726C|nr:hypothetical protein [Haloprofundus halobius]
MYMYAKWFLNRSGWTLVGGEPPGGTDALPRIEAKHPDSSEKGSRGSKKVDLIAHRDGQLLLLELKPTFDRSDVVKLDELVGDRRWRLAFLDACVERNALRRAGIVGDGVREGIVSGNSLVKGIGLSEYHDVPEEYALVVVRGERDISTHVGETCSLPEDVFTER